MTRQKSGENFRSSRFSILADWGESILEAAIGSRMRMREPNRGDFRLHHPHEKNTRRVRATRDLARVSRVVWCACRCCREPPTRNARSTATSGAAPLFRVCDKHHKYKEVSSAINSPYGVSGSSRPWSRILQRNTCAPVSFRPRSGKASVARAHRHRAAALASRLGLGRPRATSNWSRNIYRARGAQSKSTDNSPAT